MLDFFANIWDVLLWALTFTVFIGYLIALFSIITDLFRDHKMTGWVKAVWFVFLIFLPLLTTLVYLVARGRGMTQRAAESQRAAQQATEDYIRHVAGSPVEEISRAKSLLEVGAITQTEFDQLKATVLAR